MRNTAQRGRTWAFLYWPPLPGTSIIFLFSYNQPCISSLELFAAVTMQGRNPALTFAHGPHRVQDAALGRLRLQRQGLFPVLTSEVLFSQTTSARHAADDARRAHDGASTAATLCQRLPRPAAAPTLLFENLLTPGEYIRLSESFEGPVIGRQDSSDRWAPVGMPSFLF
jgi:hypothetical protein